MATRVERILRDPREKYPTTTRPIRTGEPDRLVGPYGLRATATPLKDALHAPDIGLTVISINQITKAGYTVSVEANSCKIRKKNGKVIGNILATVSSLYKVEHVYAVTPHKSKLM